MVDWGEAFRIAGTGFAGIFFLLVILAVVLFLIGYSFQKIHNKTNEPDKND
jgi:Na+-transporting methylmalonyl-CoA/oxaloacetate decarboxylase gamma subunit